MDYEYRDNCTIDESNPQHGIVDGHTTWSAKSLAVVLEQHHAVIAGYGQCAACKDCHGFIKKSHDTCECGHHFSQHK